MPTDQPKPLQVDYHQLRPTHPSVCLNLLVFTNSHLYKYRQTMQMLTNWICWLHHSTCHLYQHATGNHTSICLHCLDQEIVCCSICKGWVEQASCIVAWRCNIHSKALTSNNQHTIHTSCNIISWLMKDDLLLMLVSFLMPDWLWTLDWSSLITTIIRNEWVIIFTTAGWNRIS